MKIIKKTLLAAFAILLTACGGTGSGKAYSKEELCFSKGEQKIYGILYRPDGLEKAPVVIISHGFGGNHNFGTYYAKEIAPMGYAVYCYDFCGGGLFSKSDGEGTEMSLNTEKADLNAVIDGLRGLDYIDGEHITLIGESQGGMVSALVAGERNEQIEKLILIYPALCIKDDWVEKYPQGSDIPDTIKLFGMTIGRCYVECLYDIDVYGTIRQYGGPVKIFHGDEDKIVPLSYSERAEKEYKNASLRIMPGEGHGFHSKAKAAVREDIKEFLK